MSANPRITHNPYGYTGREMDTPRLYYYRARYYSPILRRFLSADPIEHASGDYNWYRYVGNDPVNRVDPSGLDHVTPMDNDATRPLEFHIPKQPKYLPKNVDMCKDAKESSKMSPGDFYNAVKTGGKWDYKVGHPEYENFGNYHFGYVAAAYGIPEGIAKLGAGLYQIKSGTSKLSFFDSYFDDPKDQKWIDQGYKDYEKNAYQCGCP